MKFVIIIFVIIAILFGCQPKIALPPGNVSNINTEADELAAASHPPPGKSPCELELFSKKAAEDFISPSEKYLVDLLGKYGMRDADGICFTSDKSGFFAAAHPPDTYSAEKLEIPYNTQIGGTDIFEFYYKEGKLILRNVGIPINSETWDSHPAAVDDGNGNILLVWASDRRDSLGFSSPFSGINSLSGKDKVIKGNTDLYYAFRCNGNWCEPVNFNLTDSAINTKNNEVTPFLFCICKEPVLFFASDRDNPDSLNFDIYSMKISVDFINQKIKAMQSPQMLPKGNNLINSKANELYPYIPKPYKDEEGGMKYLYFSSDRYLNPVKKPIISSKKDTIYQNVGRYDFYRFPVDEPCKIPKITYKLLVEDIENPEDIIREPVVELRNNQGNVISRKETNNAVFHLVPNQIYSAFGGSQYDRIECEGANRVISHYASKTITFIENEIIPRDTVLDIDTLAGGKPVEIPDTQRIVKTYHSSEFSMISSDSGKYIGSVETRSDSLVVTFLQPGFRTEIRGGRKERIKRRITLFDTIPKYDTSYIRSSEKMVPSELSSKGGFSIAEPENDTTITDYIKLYPRYYVFPPCKWEFITHLNDYRRNVPYFQTGFWEVNTKENLREHLKLLLSKEFSGGSFIELHPKNQYFGSSLSNLSDEAKEMRRRKRLGRIAKYEVYAKEVDENLKIMSDEIGGKILPAFKILLDKAPGAADKIIIQVEGYSDIRPIIRGDYLGSETVNYMSGRYYNDLKDLDLKPVQIRSQASLVGENNETLSQLRAYYGYKEVIKSLQNYDSFKELSSSGLILFPEKVTSENDFNRKFQDCRVIFLISGQKIDPRIKFETPGYVGREDDFSALDPVRRINIIISRIEVIDGKIIQSPCCSEDAPPINIESKELFPETDNPKEKFDY
ncbi:MAG: hypothetical protein QG635_701 [Bacteroidota bacterium]|nr:hypothetical protein [Bacteroidota bacterium]